MNDEILVTLLDQCLHQLEQGNRLEEILAEYPEMSRELRPLLEASLLAREVNTTTRVSQSTLVRNRAGFLKYATQIKSDARPKPFFSRLLQKAMPAMLVAIFLLTVMFTSLASARALPGDTLYPVKLALERTGGIFANTPAQKLAWQETFEQRRRNEVTTLLELRHNREVQFSAFLKRSKKGDWLADGIRLKFSATASAPPETWQGRSVSIWGSTQSDGSLLVYDIKPNILEWRGIIEAIQPDSVTIGGIILSLQETTHLYGKLSLGNEASVQAILLEDSQIMALSIRTAGTETTEITPTPTPPPQPGFTPINEKSPPMIWETAEMQETPEHQKTEEIKKTEQEDEHPTLKATEKESQGKITQTPEPSSPDNSEPNSDGSGSESEKNDDDHNTGEDQSNNKNDD